MQKEKLRIIRKQKGYTQQQVADFIATDVSNYSRKESGAVRIVQDEWDKLARFFEVPVEYIYEEEFTNEFVNGVVTSEEIIQYITLLEKENKALKKELEEYNQKKEAIKKILE